jgi:hypothetical protein
LSNEADLVPSELKESAMPPLDVVPGKTLDRTLSLIAVLLVVAIVIVARY